jgi:hypothetical protein
MDEHPPARAAAHGRRPSPTIRGLVVHGLTGLVVLCMAGALAAHRGAVREVLAALAAGPLALGLVLCLVYRVVNAYGWALVSRALGQPMKGTTGVRIWLMSEAFRWLPGSGWAYGSRAVLASRRGVPAATAAASVLLELLLTVAAWGLVAQVGWDAFRDPARRLAAVAPPALVIGCVVLMMAAVPAGWALASRSPGFAGRLGGLRGRFRALRQIRPDYRSLAVAFIFYVLMCFMNGFVFETVLLASPGGARCPLRAAIAANALAWLVGFFAFMAPGGLVVREGCLATLLAAWIPVEQAVVVALAWRSLQIAAEVLCVAGLYAWGVLVASRGRARVVEEH